MNRLETLIALFGGIILIIVFIILAIFVGYLAGFFVANVMNIPFWSFNWWACTIPLFVILYGLTSVGSHIYFKEMRK